MVGVVDKIIIMIIILIINIFVLLSVSGCSLLGQATEVLFNDKLESKSENIVAPKPAEQLWQTVKKSNWLVTLAIPIIALGTVAMFNGAAKLGMSAIIFGSVNLFMSLATSRFAFIMAVCGLIGSAAAVVASILTKNKALKEIIFGVQKMKEDLNTIECNKILRKKQTKSTQKIVQNVKVRAKLNGEI